MGKYYSSAKWKRERISRRWSWFQHPALTSPGASLFVSFMCRKCKKTLRNSTIAFKRMMTSSRYLCSVSHTHTHTQCPSLLLYFSLCHLLFFWPILPLTACISCFSLSLSSSAGQGKLFVLHASRELHLSLLLLFRRRFFLLFPQHRVTFAWMCSDGCCCWQAWRRYCLSNQQPASFCIAVNWCRPYCNLPGYVDVVYHGPDADIMGIITGRKWKYEFTSGWKEEVIYTKWGMIY